MRYLKTDNCWEEIVEQINADYQVYGKITKLTYGIFVTSIVHFNNKNTQNVCRFASFFLYSFQSNHPTEGETYIDHTI